MYKFGSQSRMHLDSCTNNLQKLFELAMSWGVIDFMIVYGFRSKFIQFEMFKKGRYYLGKNAAYSAADGDVLIKKHPNNWENGVWAMLKRDEVVTYFDGFDKWSNHNYYPSRAVDVVPFVNDMASYKKEHCIYLAGVVMAAAKELGVNIRWGGNWDQDGEPVTDQSFNDFMHFEEIVIDG